MKIPKAAAPRRVVMTRMETAPSALTITVAITPDEIELKIRRWVSSARLRRCSLQGILFVLR